MCECVVCQASPSIGEFLNRKNALQDYSYHVDGYSGPDIFEDSGVENLQRDILIGGGKARSVLMREVLNPEVVIYSRERFNELLSEAITALGHDSIRPWTASRLSEFITNFIMERIS